MTEALITPKILTWAIKRTGISRENVGQLFSANFPVEKIEGWELGESKPTFQQAKELAKSLQIPFGYLFLDSIPKDELAIPDLRTVRSDQRHELSPSFKKLLSDILRKVDWYKDYLSENETEKLSFVARYTVADRPEIVAKNIAQTLSLTIFHRHKARNDEELLTTLIKMCERVGIWIIRTGVVGNNTHNPLDVEEFRGFAISDEYAPLIFINGADAKPAQLFTLAHELAHIWIGESGISNTSLKQKPFSSASHKNTEKFCNRVAAELLVPKKELSENWRNDLSAEENFTNAKRIFKVSKVSLAMRAYDLKHISWDMYQEIYKNEEREWKRNKTSGGNFYNNQKYKNGLIFSTAVLNSASEGKTLYRDASKLLGIKVKDFSKYSQVIFG